MGCEGCFHTEKARQERLESAIKKAREYAVANKKTVVVYPMPDGDFAFMDQDKALMFGITAIHYISHL